MPTLPSICLRSLGASAPLRPTHPTVSTHSPIVYMSLPTAIVVEDSTVDTELGPVFRVRVVFSMMEGCALLEAYWSLRRRAAAGDSDCDGSLAGSSLGGEGRGGGAAAGGGESVVDTGG